MIVSVHMNVKHNERNGRSENITNNLGSGILVREDHEPGIEDDLK
jgi:hypothetical protein